MQNLSSVDIRQRLLHEFRAVGLATLYFGCWLAALLAIKQLILAEYRIEFNGMTKALVGTLILSKVVLVLEHVSLGARIREQPAWVDIVLRTALYAFGVFVVMLIEKGFEGRHQYGGFGASLLAVFETADMPHVWANTICLSAALVGYNVLSVLRMRLGKGGLLRLFTTPLTKDPDVHPADTQGR